MTITREQVADLREGDVVEFHRVDWPDGVVMRGPLSRREDGTLVLCYYTIRSTDGSPDKYDARGRQATLAAFSRTARLYIDHDRTYPVDGDVVRDADAPADPSTYYRAGDNWYDRNGYGVARADLPASLSLLVDGETGQVVPS